MMKLEKIIIRKEIDEDADCSYLSEERYKQYEDGKFEYINIIAEAELVNEETRKVQHIYSGGIGGIENDSNHDYMKAYVDEEIESLKDELQAIGITSEQLKNIPIEEVNE